MMSSELILKRLVAHTLEYGLRGNIDFLVLNIARNLKLRFGQYDIKPIRFELFNLNFVVKHRLFARFDTAIRFLYEFQTQFSNVIPEVLFIRVASSLKALHIYELIRAGKLEHSCQMIKKYFPINDSYLVTNTAEKEKVPANKPVYNLEHRILKLRLHWKELILDENKRKVFFEDQFRKQYDEFFLEFLFSKVVEIINLINSKLPPTVLEELVTNRFESCLKKLFDTNVEGKLKFEDDVKIELFLDNFKLYLINSSKTGKPEKHPNKYLDKILNLFYKWQASLSMDLWCNESSSSVILSTANEKIIHDILYLDCELENFSLTSHKESKKSPDKKVTINDNVTNLSLASGSTVFMSALSSLEKNSAVESSVYPTDILTDDEKENEQ